MARRRPLESAAVGAVLAAGAVSAAKLGWEHFASREDPRRFRLGEGEPASEGIVRIALGQIDGAIEQLGRGSEEAVHEARKSFKRLRAVIRLARDELGDEAYRRDNRELRDLGRRLSAARDSQVLLETLDGLDGTCEPRPALRASLAAEHALAKRGLAGARDTVVRDLCHVRERVAAWPLDRDGLKGLKPGFRRVYRRARRAYRRARRDPTVENLHELRKRTKDVRYCAQVLRPAAPKRLQRLARDAHELSDLLGEDHDLAVLAERVADDQPTAGLIEARRKRLVNDALRQGRRVYREKPRKVARVLGHAAV